MTAENIRAVVIAELGNIAPEMDIAAVMPDADLRVALDIDSMDFLNFIAALHGKLGVNIPERDYPKLLTISGAVAYLQERLKG